MRMAIMVRVPMSVATPLPIAPPERPADRKFFMQHGQNTENTPALRYL
jgi:hypothetical protein